MNIRIWRFMALECFVYARFHCMHNNDCIYTQKSHISYLGQFSALIISHKRLKIWPINASRFDKWSTHKVYVPKESSPHIRKAHTWCINLLTQLCVCRYIRLTGLQTYTITVLADTSSLHDYSLQSTCVQCLQEICRPSNTSMWWA
jgi:hypothetical protein